MRAFYTACTERDVMNVRSGVIGEDIHQLQTYLKNQGFDGSVDLIVTSPPYSTAIEYYRRHKLELVWLAEKTGLATFQDVRDHSHHYIGRYMATVKFTVDGQGSQQLSTLLDKVGGKSRDRARAISTYFQEMNSAFNRMSLALREGGVAGVVIGDSTTGGLTVPTADIYLDLAMKNNLKLKKRFSYVIRNRIMQFARKDHGGKIDFEHVLVFEKV
jgi:DNA modification methylase